ncbi:NADH-quinone oxidoreductase subunit C [Candidatus Methanomassiliicoccus intestinalis]|uniref:NADH-quinone oxidoreductase subunit C n=1 Tax=Candidatus Methanomassiliicoccus intestinalis TaxID=1406512 RepID=UPI0037DBF0FF
MNDAPYLIQNFTPVDLSELADKIKSLNADGYRLGQICGTPVEQGIELLYSLDKDFSLVNLKLSVPLDATIPSITETYWAAFIYENEIHDLFGLKFADSKLDYQGNFFKLSRPTPWKPQISPEGGD